MKHFKIKNKLFLMLASVVMPACVSADDYLTLQIFDKTGGKPVEISVDEIRKMTFNESSFTIMYNEAVKGIQVFEYDNVQGLKFGIAATGIENIMPGNNDALEISFDGIMLKLKGCSSNTKVLIFDVAGRPVLNKIVSGDADVTMGNLTAGIYVLKVNNKSFKFNKK